MANLNTTVDLKFAAIDIGSNAIRLLITNVFVHNGTPIFKKASLVRVPIRLGADAFTQGFISADKAKKLGETMVAYKHLINVHEVVSYRACATSAMRDATNGEMLAKEIKAQCGIDIEIISGKEEASIIFANHIEEKLNRERNYLYIDVGGGSTELTVFSGKKVVASCSFKVGTIRVLNNTVQQETWQEMTRWVQDNVAQLHDVMGIGSGGNINKLYRMSEVKGKQPMPVSKLEELRHTIANMTYAQRVGDLGMNLDRADVIIPACDIFLSVVKWGKVESIQVPEFGVSDGITRLLYEQYIKTKG